MPRNFDLRMALGLNVRDIFGGINILFPVDGFTTIRSNFFLLSKVPKPGIAIESISSHFSLSTDIKPSIKEDTSLGLLSIRFAISVTSDLLSITGI